MQIAIWRAFPSKNAPNTAPNGDLRFSNPKIKMPAAIATGLFCFRNLTVSPACLARMSART
ncbi:MAG TPA: hypothetical protein VF928_07225 [Usitatibacteraceae bacterium]